MIRSVFSFINNFTRKINISATAIVEGRQNRNLQQKLLSNYQNQRKAFLQQQAFKIKLANMGKTEAQMAILQNQWLNQTTNLSVVQYGQALEKLEDKLEQERQQRNRKLGHI